MHWLLLLTMAMGLVFWAQRLHTVDEVYAIAIYAAGFLSALWGLGVAPAAAQITFALLVLGWVRLTTAPS